MDLANQFHTEKMVTLSYYEASYLLPNVEGVLTRAIKYQKETSEKHGPRSVPAEMCENHVDTLRNIYNRLLDQVTAHKKGA